MNKMIKAVIFDLDGTLLDTLTTISYYGNLSLNEFGFADIDKEVYKYMIGNGAKNLVKKTKKPPTFLLMTLNFNNIYLYLLISGIFSYSEKSGKSVSKSETGLFNVSKQNPTSLDTFRRFQTEKPSKFKGFSSFIASRKRLFLPEGLQIFVLFQVLP